MPNEVYNRLVVEGPEADVQRFIERVVSKDLDHRGEPYVLDFTAHVPIPDEVDEIRRWAPDAWGCLQPMFAEIIERAPGRVVYYLVTPVDIPHPWLEATVAQEPTLTFEHEFMDEFVDDYGRLRYEGGRLVRVDDIEPTDLEWVTFEDDES